MGRLTPSAHHPVVTFAVPPPFVAHATCAAIANRHYYPAPYISPFYSPCLSLHCAAAPGSPGAPHLGWLGTWWIATPAVTILIFPPGFRRRAAQRPTVIQYS